MIPLASLATFALVVMTIAACFIAYRLAKTPPPAAVTVEMPAAAAAAAPAAVEAPVESSVDPLIVAPPMVLTAHGANISVGDFFRHSHSKYSWDDVGAELYRHIRADEILVGYFPGDLLQRLPRHTAHALKLVTTNGLRAKTLIWIAETHRDVRDQNGQPITGEAFDRLFRILAAVLSDMGVPRRALESLADLRDALRLAIVVEPA